MCVVRVGVHVGGMVIKKREPHHRMQQASRSGRLAWLPAGPPGPPPSPWAPVPAAGASPRVPGVSGRRAPLRALRSALCHQRGRRPRSGLESPAVKQGGPGSWESGASLLQDGSRLCSPRREVLPPPNADAPAGLCRDRPPAGGGHPPNVSEGTTGHCLPPLEASRCPSAVAFPADFLSSCWFG